MEHSFDYNPHIDLVNGKNRIWDRILKDETMLDAQQKRKLLFKMYTMCQLEVNFSLQP